jgi:hypothetical protein
VLKWIRIDLVALPAHGSFSDHVMFSLSRLDSIFRARAVFEGGIVSTRVLCGS